MIMVVLVPCIFFNSSYGIFVGIGIVVVLVCGKVVCFDCYGSFVFEVTVHGL